MPLFKIQPWWLGLNIIRVISVITLALIFASSIVVMVRDANAICREMATPNTPESDNAGNKSRIERTYIPSSTVPLQPGGPFFAILSRLLVVCQCPILILAEIGWPKQFFAKCLPVLSSKHGVGILGTIQVLLSTLTLSHHMPTFALVPAFFLFGMGCLNIVLGLIFRESIHAYRTREADAHENKSTEETRPVKGRTSFRPGSKQTVTYNSTGGSVYSDLKKQPPYETAYRSRGDDYRYSETAPPDGILQRTDSLGFERQAQSRAEKDGHSIPSPEQAHPKH
ncbi:hypothetical protein B0J17DRAFT_667402 [Rhizoctonia solani]|nr:hypothetical protein B0J17DRAFT_667402 [Rhizoctonia solani]